ncbi:MAG: phosphoenolpyruvate hydrolase family protein [Silicimonas sp.]|nr:phosphoenolpyruvate hydrolase family protein [Silicimonas sp.]
MAVEKAPFCHAVTIGSGLAADAADAGGADLLLVLAPERYRIQGLSPLVSHLPVRDVNDWGLNFVARELRGRSRLPLHVGLSVSDPRLDIAALVARARALGVTGLCNCPSAVTLDGRLGALLDREGLGLDRDLALFEEAAKAGLQRFAFVRHQDQARRLAEAGLDAICVLPALDMARIEETAPDHHLELERRAGHIAHVLDGLPAGITTFATGGPVQSAEAARRWADLCAVDGFVSSASLGRGEVTQSFTANPRLQTRDDPADRLIGRHPALQALREEICELAHERTPVLIEGETGTGKTHVAQLLHALGPRAARRPVTLSCASLEEDSAPAQILGLSADLPDGTAAQPGALERAAGSTLILDDIAALPRPVQGKLLRFAEDQTLQRIGDPALRRSNARIVSTLSAQPVQPDPARGLRRDLFYRLAAHQIALPPLRDCRDDIPDLALHFVREAGRQDAVHFTDKALERLHRHDWPGNLRELRNLVRRALRRSPGGRMGIDALDFLEPAPRDQTLPDRTGTEASPAARSERDWIAAALARNGFRRAQTAEELGMTTRTLYNKIKKYGLKT